jgi:hypothetical protein
MKTENYALPSKAASTARTITQTSDVTESTLARHENSLSIFNVGRSGRNQNEGIILENSMKMCGKTPVPTRIITTHTQLN